MSSRTAEQDERLSGSERRLVVALGSPALGLALTVTVISTYLPVLVAQRTNAVVVGALIAGEGFFGIFMPGLLGTLSDRTASRIGDRLRMLVPCALVVVVAVAAIDVAVLLGRTAGERAAGRVAARRRPGRPPGRSRPR